MIDLDRAEEFELIDLTVETSMESMFFEIKSLIVPETDVHESSGLSSNTSTGQQSVQLPKTQLTLFESSLLHWRSFRDIYISLVHKNRSICDAERFHYLI